MDGEAEEDPNATDPAKNMKYVYLITMYEPKDGQNDRKRPSRMTRQDFADAVLEKLHQKDSREGLHDGGEEGFDGTVVI